jgi:hypothetical protein
VSSLDRFSWPPFDAERRAGIKVPMWLLQASQFRSCSNQGRDVSLGSRVHPKGEEEELMIVLEVLVDPVVVACCRVSLCEITSRRGIVAWH